MPAHIPFILFAIAPSLGEPPKHIVPTIIEQKEARPQNTKFAPALQNPTKRKD